MEKYITSDNQKLRYKIEGEGIPVVLIHGYLESIDIWDDFAPELANTCQVIRVDMPGHGESNVFDDTVTVEDMADAVAAVFELENIAGGIVIGHSMGGYATMAFVDKFPEKVLGFCLFHSSPFADTDEKKAARMREIGFVEAGKKDLIISNNIPNAFANDNLNTFKDAIERAKLIGSKTPDKGVIAALKGMMLRPDRSDLLDNNMNKLFILGKKDNYIPFEKMNPVLSKARKGKVEVFQSSGHMGFIEEKKKSVEVLMEFIKTFD